MFEAAAADADLAPAERRTLRSWPREIVATLSLAWPLILSNMAGTALTAVDVILLGRLSPEALASGALGTSLFHAVLVSAIGLVTAVSPLIAAEYGSRPHGVREIRRTVRQGLWVAITVTVPATIFLLKGEALLVALGQKPDLATGSGHYLAALQWALLPNLAFLVLRSFMAALGWPGWGLAIALLAIPLNFLLAWMLIFGHLGAPALGLSGAGIATTITASSGFLALAAVTRFDRRFRRYHVFGRFWRADWPRFLSIWRIGLPIAVTLAFEVALFGAAGLAMGIIGTVELGAHTVALQIASMCFMVPLGVAQAATIRVGHALGAEDRSGIRRAGWAAFGIAMAFMVVTATMLLGVPRVLVDAYLDPAIPANAAVATVAVHFLGFAALFQLADGAQVVAAGMLRGLKDTRVPMIYAGLGYWVIGAPLGFVLAFPYGLGGSGIWMGLAIGLAAVAAGLLQRWVGRDRLKLGTLPA